MLSDHFPPCPEDRALHWLVTNLRQWVPLRDHFGPERIVRVASVDERFLLAAQGDALQIGGVLVDVEGRISGVSFNKVRIYIGYVTDLPGVEIEDDAVTDLSLTREILRFLYKQGHGTLGGNVSCVDSVVQVGFGSHNHSGRVRVFSALEAVYGLDVELRTQEVA